MTTRILVGDARERLKELPDNSVHCVVTSPPYFGLRDYGVDGQMGLEETPAEYVDSMVELFREVRRVLRDDGTLWLNLGDSYAGSWGAQGREGTPSKNYYNNSQLSRNQILNHPKRARFTGAVREGGVKPKDLYGIPWRVAFALQADGWYLRQDIIWSKPNPMPESVRDRCTKAHEYIFLLSNNERYFYDAEAIAEPAVKAGQFLHSYGSGAKDRQDVSATNDRRTRIGLANWNRAQPETRNKRSVWEVTTQGFSEAHFATFPPALIEPCIKAGCPAGGTVLDPFGGAGTTGLVADRLRRDAILIELNPDYAAIAQRRIKVDGGIFTSVVME